MDGLKSIYIYKVIEDVNTLHTALNENSGDVSPIIKNWPNPFRIQCTMRSSQTELLERYMFLGKRVWKK